MKRQILFGACIFDEPNLPTSGWASISGEESTRINGVNELPQDVFWITNLNYRIYTRLNLNKTLHIFDEQYFRSSVKSIGQEVGLLNDSAELSRFCSRVFQNTYQETESILGKSLPVHGYRFFSGLSDILAPGQTRRVPSHASGRQIQQVMKECTQSNQAMFGVRPPQGSSAYPFVIPRAANFDWIMKQGVPTCDNWKALKESSVGATIGVQHGRQIKGTPAVLDKYLKLSEHKACFLRITVKSTDPFYQPFATFSSGANHMRGHATLPEIMNLARFARVEVGGGYSCDLMKLSDLGIDYEANLFSYSRGLALENIFAALANPVNGEKSGNYNGLSAYLRAYDRIICQRYAELLAKAGLTVGAYGTGKIMVYCKKYEADFIFDAAHDAGIIAPMALREEL